MEIKSIKVEMVDPESRFVLKRIITDKGEFFNRQLCINNTFYACERSREKHKKDSFNFRFQTQHILWDKEAGAWNSTAKKRSCPIWHAMYHYFTDNQEDFKYHYGQRAQVESCFSRIKRNWGEFLKSKTFEAQQNEVLLKCLCHNIACLVAQIFERDIKINFEDCSKEILSQ